MAPNRGKEINKKLDNLYRGLFGKKSLLDCRSDDSPFRPSLWRFNQ
jgi:hypothetical protein